MGTPEGDRLQKVLARAGLGSRRAVERLIEQGRVTVNGERAELGRRVVPTKDIVEVDGSAVPTDARLRHYLANKPEGVVSTARDPEGRPTVMDLVDLPDRVWPVGRLDIDTEGAILLTNDGDLTHRVTHPSFGIPRTYLAEVAGGVRERDLRTLRSGVVLDDGLTAPATVRLVDRLAGSSLVEITLTEGRNRQVRRMFEVVGHPVARLARVAIGPVRLGRLKAGGVRRLAPEEVRALYRACGL